MEWPKFRGIRRESALEYVEALEACYMLANIADETPMKREAILKVQFRSGLLGDAEKWLRYEASAEEKASFATLCAALKRRFPEPAAAADTAALQEAASFTRRSGETLADFAKRAEKLNMRLRSDEHRRILATNLLMHIADAESDVHIQERVVDRLANKGKLVVVEDGRQVLLDSCTFRDVYQEVLACSSRFGQLPNRGDEMDDDDDLILRRDFGRFQKIFEKLADAPTRATQTTQAPPAQPPAPSSFRQAYGGHQVNGNAWNQAPTNWTQQQPPSWTQQQQPSWTQQQQPSWTQPQQPTPQQQRNPSTWQNSNRGTYTYQGVRRPLECDNCQKVGDHISTNCPEPRRPLEEVLRNRAARRMREEQAQRQQTTAPVQPQRQTAKVATVTHDESGDTSHQVAAIFSPPWQNGSSCQVRDVLNVMEHRERRALDAGSFDGEVRAARVEPPRPSRQRDKGALLMPETSKVTKTKIVLKKSSAPKPRVVEIPDGESEESWHQPREPSPERMSEVNDEGEPEDVPSDPEDGDIDEVNADHRTNWQRRLLEELASREAERARQEFLSRGTRPQASTTPLAPPHFSATDVAQMEAALAQLQTNYQTATKDSAVKDRSRITALSQAGVDPLNIAQILKNVTLEIPLWQLLDVAPRARADLNRLLTTETHASKGKKKKPRGPAISFLEPVGRLERPEPGGYRDVALSLRDVGDTGVGYVEGFVDGVYSHRLMLDDGASLDCVSPGYAEKRKLKIHAMEKPWTIKLADERMDTISKYAIIDVVVGDVLTVMTAFVYGSDRAFEILLSQAWYRRVRAIQDWDKGTVVVRGRNGYRGEVSFRPESDLDYPRISAVSENPSVEGMPAEVTEADAMEHFAAVRRMVTVLEFSELVKGVFEGAGKEDS